MFQTEVVEKIKTHISLQHGAEHLPTSYFKGCLPEEGVGGAVESPRPGIRPPLLLMIKNVQYMSSYNVSVVLVRFSRNLNIFHRLSKNKINIKFHEKSDQREPNRSMRKDRRTDRHDEANIRF